MLNPIRLRTEKDVYDLINKIKQLNLPIAKENQGGLNKNYLNINPNSLSKYLLMGSDEQTYFKNDIKHSQIEAIRPPITFITKSGEKKSLQELKSMIDDEDEMEQFVHNTP